MTRKAKDPNCSWLEGHWEQAQEADFHLNSFPMDDLGSPVCQQGPLALENPKWLYAE